VASAGYASYLIDTKIPNPDAQGDTLGRIYWIKEHIISLPMSLGSILKQNYWDYCDPEKVLRASVLVKGTKELAPYHQRGRRIPDY
jgi:hypothetical protein